MTIQAEPLALTSEQEARARDLHTASIVVNTYGGPFSAPRSIRRWRTGYMRDSGEWVPPVAAAVREHLVPDMRAGGMDAIVVASGGIPDIGLWHREFHASAPDAVLATSTADVRRAKEAGSAAFILGGSGANLEGGLDTLYVYHRAGVRLWSLTHSDRNLISDGCGEPTNAGLGRFGRRFVRALNEHRILIDVSHISDSGFWDVIEASSAPFLATHSNCRAVCDHGRNLTDDMIRAIADHDGIVGLNFFPDFVKPHPPTVFDLVDHIDHIYALVGPGRVALGPDFCAGRWDWVVEAWWREGSSDHNARRLAVPYPEGVEDTTAMLNMTRALVARGYADQDITDILGASFLRLFDRVVS